MDCDRQPGVETAHGHGMVGAVDGTRRMPAGPHRNVLLVQHCLQRQFTRAMARSDLSSGVLGMLLRYSANAGTASMQAAHLCRLARDLLPNLL